MIEKCGYIPGVCSAGVDGWECVAGHEKRAPVTPFLHVRYLSYVRSSGERRLSFFRPADSRSAEGVSALRSNPDILLVWKKTVPGRCQEHRKSVELSRAIGRTADGPF